MILVDTSFWVEHQLMGRAIGFIDAHRLASALLAQAPLWTRERSLFVIAIELQMASLI